MIITRIYSDEQGESHFQDMEVPLKDSGSIGRLSDPIDVSSISFRETGGDYDYDWHTAPRRQYIIMLGQVDIQVSDGERRIFDSGDIVLVEDTTGKGHKSRAVRGQMRRSVFVALE